MDRIAVSLVWSLICASAWAAPRTTLVVPVPTAAGWEDLAYLAGIPAAERVNVGGGSLVAVDSTGTLTPEFLNYTRRYKPTATILLDDGKSGERIRRELSRAGYGTETLKAHSAETASLAFSRRFWRASRVVVLCRANDYDSALLAAPIAAKLDAPLLFTSDIEIDAATSAELKRLGVSEIVSIGSSRRLRSARITSLVSPMETMVWAKQKGFKISYLAAVNPLDRSHFATRKLSLLGAQLAAGRKGLVVPLAHMTQWKRPFPSAPLSGRRPQGVPGKTELAKAGTIQLGNEKVPFVLTGSKDEDNLALALDQDGDGKFSGRFVSGDRLNFDGKEWVLSLGTRTKFGKTDVHLTWPTAEQLDKELERYFAALGSPPEHLCLVGFPDALPHAIYGQGGIVEEQASDLPFSMVGEGQFAEIGVGRIIAENVAFGSLYAARVLTYRDLLSPEWATNASQAEWENALGALFANVGYETPFHLTPDQIPWAVKPANGQEGRREPSFSQSSPLARSAILAHSEHSSWQGLGAMFSWDATVLMAPTVIESGGCGTTCLDREPDNRSVVARFLRLGAVSFAGGSRELSAESQPLRSEFWNGVLAGETIGQAHRRAQNTGLLTARDLGEGPRGAYRYSTQVRMQFGDPALSLALPSRPKSAPAKTEVRGDQVSVFAPAEWWIVKIVVPPDWKQWDGKDLYAVRGAGAYALSSWGPNGHDVEQVMVNAEFTTKRKVKSITQNETPVAPLGWRGKWHSTLNRDGTYTHRFAVKMIDFDQERGKILRSIKRLNYTLSFE